MSQSETKPVLGGVGADGLRAGSEKLMRLALARSWMDLNERDEDREMAVPGSRFRHSNAGNCARALQYKIEGAEPTEPLTINSLWTFALGQFVHDSWQPALQAVMPGIEIETKHVSMDGEGSCHLDGEIAFEDGSVQIVEIKSINGYAFKGISGVFKNARKGIRHSHLLQTACNAAATPGCVGAWAIIISLEQISPPEAAKNDLDLLERFMYVEYFTIDELRPIAEAEFARVAGVLATVDQNRANDEHGHDVHHLVPRSIPDPEIPEGAVVTDPAKGAWAVLNAKGEPLDLGTTWHCGYCNYRSLCIEDGA